MGRAFLRRIAIATMGLGLCGSSGAWAETSYVCRMKLNAASREHVSEEIRITLPDPTFHVTVSDRISEQTVGHPVEAEVVGRSASRISFSWSLRLRKQATGAVVTTFHMSLFPARKEATLSVHWANANWGENRRSVSTTGVCRPVAGG
jgi:hypothetical protein